MKVYIVPSSLFVAGRIMQPLWIARDIEALQAKKKHQEEEAAKILATTAAIAEAEERLKAFDKWRAI